MRSAIRCCPECFNDDFIRGVALRLSNTTGTCSVCRQDETLLLSPASLVDYLEPVLLIYQESSSPNALQLPELLRQDWGFFESMGGDDVLVLLEEMFPGVYKTGMRFVGPEIETSSSLADWDAFRGELQHGNRYFTTARLDSDLDRPLFNHLSVEESLVPEVVYRARICSSAQPFKPSEMGAPPPSLATPGRANPRGIPYLYTASDDRTAIHELRPHPAEYVCVASIAVGQSRNLADLRAPRVSPFRIDEGDLLRTYGQLTGIRRLGDELSKPIPPELAEMEYLPSQYLSEFLKHCDFDGLIYDSAMGAGTNYAFFDPGKFAPQEVRMFRITKADLEYEKAE